MTRDDNPENTNSHKTTYVTHKRPCHVTDRDIA